MYSKYKSVGQQDDSLKRELPISHTMKNDITHQHL